MIDLPQIRIHGAPSLPTLIYLPGIHGDWSLIAAFRAMIRDRVRFVEITYPLTTTWTLDDYARGVLEILASHGIPSGWILGESFGSLVAWAMLDRLNREKGPSFQVRGLILAGGFARHPCIPMVRLAGWIHRHFPPRFTHAALSAYARYARWRHHHVPGTVEGLAEFTRHRADPADRLAILHRYQLILRADFRPFARLYGGPVHVLMGGLDFIVPWPPVRRWFRQNCTGRREERIVRGADHNVLSTAPDRSADQILRWMRIT